MVNIVYTLNTVLNMMLVYISYNKKASFTFTLYPAYILFCLRQIIRLIDFEQTKLTMTPIQWYDLSLMQSNAYGFLCSIYYMAFYRERGSFIIFTLFIWVGNVIRK